MQLCLPFNYLICHCIQESIRSVRFCYFISSEATHGSATCLSKNNSLWVDQVQTHFGSSSFEIFNHSIRCPWFVFTFQPITLESVFLGKWQHSSAKYSQFWENWNNVFPKFKLSKIHRFVKMCPCIKFDENQSFSFSCRIFYREQTDIKRVLKIWTRETFKTNIFINIGILLNFDINFFI